MSGELFFATELAVSGLLVGIMYSLVALGFVLIYKASGIFNFAQGAMTLFAALALVGFLPWFGMGGALVAVLLLMILLAFAIERIMLRPLVARSPLALFMATIGLGFFLEGLSQAVWGTQPKGLDIGITDTPFVVAGLFISRLDLVGAVVAAALVLALVWFFQRTTTGLGLRAVSDDHEAALSVGIPLAQAWATTWAIAGVVAMVAGFLWGSRLGVQFSLSLVALKALPVLIIGGLESVPGAIIGGLIVGAIERLAGGFVDPYVGGGVKDFSPYLLALVFLIFRPYGLFGREIIERV
ncbi:MAG: branched-chain amino acid ABC transporter permease [Nitrospinae bacterium]|nr:branched-chain amino acid ABC transporter permease [Nitrospinota bacterium]